jgi:DNA-binding FadR family transcriptional regulator
MIEPGPADPTAVAFRPIRSGNAFEDCVERVLSALKLGIVSPGERLPAERELATRLGVSRTTLREALRSLGDAGWVEVRRGRHGGAFVTDRRPASMEPARPPSATDLEDVLVLRRVLDLGAVEIAASTPLSADALAGLQSALADCEKAPVERYRPADSRLHLAIAELAGSPSLVAAAAEARVRINDLLDAIPLLERNIAHSNRQHEQIVRAIARGQPAAARAAMEEHLAGSAALLRAFLS